MKIGDKVLYKNEIHEIEEFTTLEEHELDGAVFLVGVTEPVWVEELEVIK